MLHDIGACAKHAATRLHLWIGEFLGLTHYRNCHTCVHRDKHSSDALVWCDLLLGEHGCLACTDPCEAVWCDKYERATELRQERDDRRGA